MPDNDEMKTTTKFQSGRLQFSSALNSSCEQPLQMQHFQMPQTIFNNVVFCDPCLLQLQHNPSWNSSWCRLVTRLESSEGSRAGNTGCSYLIWAVGSIDLSCVSPVLAFYNLRLSASLLKNWQSCPSCLISLANHLNIRFKRQSELWSKHN